MADPEFDQRVYAVLRQLPIGSVSTYGDVARAAGKPRGARHVGHALGRLREDDQHADVPWYRIVNASGSISTSPPERQRKLLIAEGIQFTKSGRIKRFAEHRFPLDLLTETGG
ncbi:MGMT family protein [Gammaproteobacteria bacterium]|nr:MGMT family protein [Gammaproteobacteria bacterium]